MAVIESQKYKMTNFWRGKDNIKTVGMMLRIPFVFAAIFLATTNLRTLTGSMRRLSTVKTTEHLRHPQAQAQQLSKRRKRPSIVLFGDSLTQRSFGEEGSVGWAALLAGAYTRRADVKNRGFGGYNTNHALQVWPHVAEAYEDSVLFATLFFGANDAALPGNAQHVPVDNFRDNMALLIMNIRLALKESNPLDYFKIPLFILTPPPVDEVAWAKHRGNATATAESSNRRNSVARQYGSSVKFVAQQQQHSGTIVVVDTWEILQGNNKTVYPQYLSDGLHLNELGNRKIYEGMMDLLHQEFPLLAPKTDNHQEGIPFEQKTWQEYEQERR